MTSWLAIVGQVITIMAGLWIFQRMVLPQLRAMQQPALVYDVWLPLVLVTPLLFHVVSLHMDVSTSVGWTVLGAPVWCGGVALVAALAFGPGLESRPVSPGAWGLWSLVGVILVLLAALGEMSVWLGQCGFAAAAVMLWINTPPRLISHTPDGSQVPHPADFRAGFGTLLMLGMALLQGGCTIFIDASLLWIAAALSLGQVVLMILFIAREAGGAACLRVGGWMATVGVLFGMGVVSMRTMIPVSLHVMIHDRTLGRPSLVGYGYGTLAFEGMMLALLAAGAVIVPRISAFWRPWLATAGMGLLIAWAKVRLSG
jgi:hypothetical protein